MALPLYDVNYIAIIVCVAIHMMLGMAWYSNFMFGAVWRKMMGISDAQMRKGQENMGKSMLIAIVTSFILIFMLAQAIKSPQIDTAMESIEMAFWLWVGFIATVMVGSVIWEGKPWKLYLINSGYYLVTLIISSIILYYWN